MTHFLRKEYGTFRLYSGNENGPGEQLLQAPPAHHLTTVSIAPLAAAPPRVQAQTAAHRVPPLPTRRRCGCTRATSLSSRCSRSEPPWPFSAPRVRSLTPRAPAPSTPPASHSVRARPPARRACPAGSRAWHRGVSRTKSLAHKTAGVCPWPCPRLTLHPPRAHAAERRPSGFAFTFYMLLFHYLSNLPLDQPLYFGVHMRFWMQAHPSSELRPNT